MSCTFTQLCTLVSGVVADPDPHGSGFFWEAGFGLALEAKGGFGRFALTLKAHSGALEAQMEPGGSVNRGRRFLSLWKRAGSY